MNTHHIDLRKRLNVHIDMLTKYTVLRRMITSNNEIPILSLALSKGRSMIIFNGLGDFAGARTRATSQIIGRTRRIPIEGKRPPIVLDYIDDGLTWRKR